MTFDTIPPHETYPGLTRLRLDETRSIVCVGVGEDVEEAISRKARPDRIDTGERG